MHERTLTDSDHHELQRLVVEASYRLDHGQADTMHALFTEDGHMEFSGIVLDGRDEIAAWGQGRVARSRLSRHVTTNSRFDLVAEDEAQSTTIVMAFLHDGPPPGVARPAVVGEYHDTFRRERGSWYISSRRLDVLFADQAS